MGPTANRLVTTLESGLQLDTIAAVVILGVTGCVVWFLYRRGR